MSDAKPGPTITTTSHHGDSRSDAILRAIEEWYSADETTGTHPLFYFAKLLNDPRKLRLLQTGIDRTTPRARDGRQAVAGLFIPTQHYVKLDITSVQPARAWPDDSVTIGFRVENRLLGPTSGVVSADVTQGLGGAIASVGIASGAIVAPLQPGQMTTGTIVVKNWHVDPKALDVGTHNVWLQYWVEDPNGTISVVYGILGPNQIVKTYSSIAIAGADLDVYPTCKPNGPDFIDLSTLATVPANAMVVTDATGNELAFGQKVTVQWSVASGGFPATDKHVGSISSTTLNFPFPHPIPPTGQQTFDLSAHPAGAYTPIAVTLHATGNCGDVSTQITIPVVPPPPIITSFTASATSVAKGDVVTLSWKVANFPWQQGKSLTALTIFEVDPNSNKILATIYQRDKNHGGQPPAQGSTSVAVEAHRVYLLEVVATDLTGNWLQNAFKSLEITVTPGQVQAGVRGIRLFNCTDDMHEVTVWVHDRTANTGWVQKAMIANQYDANSNSCPADPTKVTTITFDQNGHDYEVRVVDSQAAQCNGQNDPTNGNCIRWSGVFHALAAGPLTDPLTVT